MSLKGGSSASKGEETTTVSVYPINFSVVDFLFSHQKVKLLFLKRILNADKISHLHLKKIVSHFQVIFQLNLVVGNKIS